MKGSNSVEYAGQGQTGGTPFSVANGAVAGDAVALTAAHTAGRGAAGNPLLGKLVLVEKDGLGTVNHQDAVTLPCVVGLTPGYKNLVVDGAGKVKEAGAGAFGRPALVIMVQNGMAAIDLG